MANGIEVVLELISGNFDAKLKHSKGELEGFGKIAGSLGGASMFGAMIAPLAAVLASVTTIAGVMAGMHSAVELGEQMVNLSNRTGIAVENLMMMRRLFKDSGLEVDKIGTSIGRMQKTIGKAANTGEGAVEFAKLGLKPQDLEKAKPDDAFKQIGSAIAAIENPTKRGEAAMAIFGRAGTELLQVFLNPDFKNAGNISQTAKVMGENAYLFKEAGDQLSHIGGKLTGLFIGMAAPLLVAIEPLLTWLDSLDLSGFGTGLGNLLGNFVGDFSGAIQMLIGDMVDEIIDTFTTLDWFVMMGNGLAAIGEGLLVVFLKLGDFLVKIFKHPLDLIQSGIEFCIQQLMQALGKIPGVASALGLSGFKAQSFGDIQAETKKNGNGLENMRKGSGELEDALWGDMKKHGAAAAAASPKRFYENLFKPTEDLAKAQKEGKEHARDKFKVNLGGEGDELSSTGKNSFADSLRKIGGGGYAGGQGDPLLNENKTQTGYLKIIADGMKRPMQPGFGDAGMVFG